MQKSLALFVLGALLTTAAASVIALFFAGDGTHVWDILKLALQGLGALVIARLAVVWAVETFKSQKSWERDAANFVGILAALREMDRANEIMFNGAIGAKLYSEDYLAEAENRWVSARMKFDDAAAGAVFFPPEVSMIVLQLERELANVQRHDTYAEYLDHRGAYVSGALKKLERNKHLF